MAKTKTISSSTPTFAVGGKTKMFGKQHVGQQTPGQTATKSGPERGDYAKGGKTKMFGKQSVKPSKKQ